MLRPKACAVEDDLRNYVRSIVNAHPKRNLRAAMLSIWVSLCKRPSEQGRIDGPRLWPALVTMGFPHLPKAKRTRSQVFHALNSLRDLRNRVFHHEAVWDRKLDRRHAEIIETIGWLNRDLAAALEAHSPLPTTIDKGVAGFRAQAEAIIK